MNNDNLFQLIKKNIKENSNIKIAIKKFSLRAFYKLIPFFKKCSTVRIILTDINDYEEKYLTVKWEGYVFYPTIHDNKVRGSKLVRIFKILNNQKNVLD